MRLALVLALILMVRPHLLDVFLTRNQAFDRPFTEFGCSRDATGDLWPTGATLAFLLGGTDLVMRFSVEALFADDHLFSRCDVLRLVPAYAEQPLLAGSLRMSPESVARLTSGRVHRPDSHPDFPARRIETKQSWNDVVLHPATLVKRDPSLPVPGTQVITQQTSDTMRKLLHLVVEDGTGKKATVDGYLVGGKTGTSEKVGRKGGYNKKALFNTFIAAFPMNAPRYTVFVTIDEPHGNKKSAGFETGGWVAAPAVARVISAMGPLLGIPAVDPASPNVESKMEIDVTPSGRRVAAN